MANHDPFDFSRFLGGNLGFGMPGLVTPTLDIDELDKRIKDLKAVEGWLSMNLSMLQMTIQGLEVQRNTLSSLKAMGEAFSQSMNDVTAAAKRQGEASVAPPSEPAPTSPPPTDKAQVAEAETAAEGVEPTEKPEVTEKPLWPWDMAAKAMADFQQHMQENAGKAAEAIKATVAASEVKDPPAKKRAPKKTVAEQGGTQQASRPARSRKPKAE